MQAYDDLMAFQRQTEALGQVAGRLGWDQETMMARGSAPQRAEEHGAMAAVLHERRVDPRIGDWLATCEAGDLGEVARANLRHIRRSYDRATKVPARLASELASTTSTAHGVWAEARANEDFNAFRPWLEKVIALRVEEADALRTGTQSRYDALVQDYEPGASEASLAEMFGALRPRLVALREAIMGSSVQPLTIDGAFEEDAQLALSRELAVTFGYDLSKGRIDKAVHPFSSGSGIDVRITTRTSEDDPFNCIYSTIHEVGHACYEQGIDADYLLTPLGNGVSMGVHESQSRIYENQMGRSRAFVGHLFGLMHGFFGDMSATDADQLYATINRVNPGYIRTEADEVHYNLHILMRFDLERALLSGDLTPAELPAAWNARFLADFGERVDKPSNGALQDVHWSEGLFGYFPTYTLGNVYAGCLNAAMRRDLPSVDADLARGDTSAATGWLRDNLQRHGSLYEPVDVVTRACGQAPTVEPLLDYLEAKFGALYNL